MARRADSNGAAGHNSRSGEAIPGGPAPESTEPPPPATRRPASAAEARGADLARAALDAARAAARGRPLRGDRTGSVPLLRARRGGLSGPGPDERDPQPFGAAISRLMADRGWESTAGAAGVLSRWDSLVGPDLAAHCQPTGLVNGELVLVAESTAWATQVRLLLPSLHARLREQLGADVVRRISVRGPTAPSWSKGPRRVTGRGPRDTYG